MAERLERNKKVIITVGEIVVPHSDMPSAFGIIDCQEWAVGVLTEPRKYVHSTKGGQRNQLLYPQEDLTLEETAIGKFLYSMKKSKF